MYMVYSSMFPTPLHALAAQPHIGSEAARERWDSASSPHVGVIGVMIYRHSDDGAWWRTEGSRAHLGLISPPPLHQTSHWVSVSDRYICQSTCWQSRPLTFCTSCGYTRGWIFRLRVRRGGTETPLHGCWRSGSLSAVPPLTMAFALPNETSCLWFPLETRVPQHSRLDLKGWYPSSHSSKSLSISVLSPVLLLSWASFHWATPALCLLLLLFWEWNAGEMSRSSGTLKTNSVFEKLRGIGLEFYESF